MRTFLLAWLAFAPAVLAAADPKPASNLTVPADLPPKIKEQVEAAIKAFKSAESAESGQQRRLKEAISKLSAASRRAPQLALPHYYLGISYQITKDFKKARQSIEKALSLNDKFHEAYIELADIHVWEKDFAGSIAVYDKALALDPKNAVALERKSNALIRLERFQEAKTEIEKAQKIEKSPLREYLLLELVSAIKGPGWKETFVAETENYRVSTSVSEAFANEIAKQAELIRSAYEAIFPNITRPEKKYQIWLHADKDAYHKSGGPPQAGGHYSPNFQKLVLFKYPKKEDTYLVLNHEAFHQYLHEYLELAPQWFNEGLGDYFGPFIYMRKDGRDVLVSRPNPWRLQNIQQAIRLRLCPTPTDLMLMSREQMYHPSMAGIHYAQAWSLIYFMLEGRGGNYREVLVKYFQELRKGTDLNTSFERTFGRVNMEKFESEWKSYITGLKSS